MRTGAALEPKQLLPVLVKVVMDGATEPLSEKDMLKIATARAIILQGLGNTLIRMCLGVKDSPYKIW